MNSTFAQVNSQSSLEKLPPRSLVFIDSGVEDYESIAAGVLPGQQVVILDRNKNGIEQITSEIENYSSTNGRLDSVHIISHGNSGNLQLGNTTDRDGAIGTTDEVSLTVDNVQFNNNVADKGGGAIFGNFNNTLTVSNSKFN